MMRLLGLTGSIGMGKSATAAMFADAGVPVHDADAAVHRLYRGKATPLLEAEFPGVTRDGAVDRGLLAERVVGNAQAMARLEAIVHPLVRADEAAFLRKQRAAGRSLVLLDVPLLFEAGAAARFDAIIVVSADADTQRSRVLARPGMTTEKFESLLGWQMADAEKRRRAHFIIDTSGDFASTRRQVGAILRALA